MVVQKYLDQLSVAVPLPFVFFNMGGHHPVVTLVIGSALGKREVEDISMRR
jgi:hypothetical protein